MSKFSTEYYDPNHPGWSAPMSRIATREKISAIVKMRLGTEPPPDYVRMKIGGDAKTGGVIFTIEAYEEDLEQFGKEPNVLSLEYARPTHQLRTILNNMPQGDDGDCTTGSPLPRPLHSTPEK